MLLFLCFLIFLSEKLNQCSAFDTCYSTTLTNYDENIVFAPIFLNYSSQIVAVGDSLNRISFWDTESQQEGLASFTAHSKQITVLRQLNPYALLASASYDKSVIIWDLYTLKMLINFREHQFPVVALAFSSTRSTVYSADKGGFIYGFHYTSGELLVIIKDSSPIWHLAFISSREYLVYVSEENLVVYDLITDMALIKIPANNASGITNQEDAVIYATFANSSDILILDLQTLKYHNDSRMFQGRPPERMGLTYCKEQSGLISVSGLHVSYYNLTSNLPNIDIFYMDDEEIISKGVCVYNYFTKSVLILLKKGISLYSMAQPFYSFNGVCVNSCPRRTFIDPSSNNSKICQQCHQTCDNCSGSAPSACISCRGGYYYFYGLCETKCPTGSKSDEQGNTCTCENGFYFNSSNIYSCEKCEQECSTCIGSSSNCTTCAPGYFENPSTNPNSFHCSSCIDGCQTCTNGTTCSVCKDDYFISENICWKKCPPHQFFNLESKQCESCFYNCETCSGANSHNCLSCKENFYLSEDGSCKSSDEDRVTSILIIVMPCVLGTILLSFIAFCAYKWWQNKKRRTMHQSEITKDGSFYRLQDDIPENINNDSQLRKGSGFIMQEVLSNEEARIYTSSPRFCGESLGKKA